MLAHRRPSTLSRTSSTTSIESDDGAESTSHRIRRTRKRFSEAQLVVLEQLFHQTSHPSREQRDLVANAGRMETKSVTIWFQNKRQTERKVSGTTTHSHHHHYDPRFARSSSHPYIPMTRPSLDSVASRTERTAPNTPTRKPGASLWDNMPSSPALPPNSPPPKEFVEFGKLTRTRTLEWACARSRLVDKENLGEHERKDSARKALPLARASTWNGWSASVPAEAPVNWTAPAWWKESGTPDDDMLGAALALCGLGRDL
ncbi:hypothetical protein BDZ89DRAFT_1167272 [Hymenopellis radicata]|nr:hypothetical protein BDZ89DRAFT_1167272 [Hymenopellis radicata]